mmetsp:Transcript_37795/g.95006  ORF Transcript_37795/g.95006 Transcript_37795/m.95006 type:complete len:448 (+) Transcript_37795:168-1511(+)
MRGHEGKVHLLRCEVIVGQVIATGLQNRGDGTNAYLSRDLTVVLLQLTREHIVERWTNPIHAVVHNIVDPRMPGLVVRHLVLVILDVEYMGRILECTHLTFLAVANCQDQITSTFGIDHAVGSIVNSLIELENIAQKENERIASDGDRAFLSVGASVTKAGVRIGDTDLTNGQLFRGNTGECTQKAGETNVHPTVALCAIGRIRMVDGDLTVVTKRTIRVPVQRTKLQEVLRHSLAPRTNDTTGTFGKARDHGDTQNGLVRNTRRVRETLHLFKDIRTGVGLGDIGHIVQSGLKAEIHNQRGQPFGHERQQGGESLIGHVNPSLGQKVMYLLLEQSPLSKALFIRRTIQMCQPVRLCCVCMQAIHWQVDEPSLAVGRSAQRWSAHVRGENRIEILGAIHRRLGVTAHVGLQDFVSGKDKRSTERQQHGQRDQCGSQRAFALLRIHHG